MSDATVTITGWPLPVPPGIVHTMLLSPLNTGEEHKYGPTFTSRV